MHCVLHVCYDLGVFCLCCGLFDDGINISDNIASNDKMISAKGIVVCVKGSGRSLLENTIQAFAYRDWEKPRKI
jgi:hypothetical protein